MKVHIFIGIVLFIALYVLSLVYLGRRIHQGVQMVLPEKFTWVFYTAYSLLAFAMVFGMMPVSFPLKSLLSTAGAYFMGFYAYGLMLFLLRDGVFLLGRLLKVLTAESYPRFMGTSALLLTMLSLFLVVYGSIHAGNIKTVSYEVDSTHQELPEKMKIVLLSDLHLGAVGSEKRLPDIVEKVQKEKADLILIAGDIFDDDFHLLKKPEEAKELFLSMNATYGTYASLGNHDGGKTLPDMLAFLEESGITVLMEEYEMIEDSFVILGRLDPSPIGGFGDRNRRDTEEVLKGLPSNLPVIVLDHTPTQVEQYEKGVDLVLSGHTHRGQIFPFQFATKLLFTVDYGYYQKEETSPVHIVTSGAGTWGPPMRIGTNSEIVRITLSRVKR